MIFIALIVRPHSPACRADWRRRGGVCPRARRRSAGLPTRPGPTSTSWPRRRNSLMVASGTRDFDHQHAGPRRARPERNREMLGVPGRRVDRFLQIHAGMDVAQEELRRPLVLLVAAGRAPGEIGLAVAQRQRRRQRRARALARRKRRRMLSSSQNICARVPRQKPSSGITGEDCSQPPDGVDGHHVAGRIDDVEMHGVAGMTSPHAAPTVGSPAPSVADGERAARSSRVICTAPPKPSIVAGPQLERGAVGDQLAALMHCRRRTAASRSARRRNPDRRRTSRGRRKRAWPPRPASG